MLLKAVEGGAAPAVALWALWNTFGCLWLELICRDIWRQYELPNTCWSIHLDSHAWTSVHKRIHADCYRSHGSAVSLSHTHICVTYHVRTLCQRQARHYFSSRCELFIDASLCNPTKTHNLTSQLWWFTKRQIEKQPLLHWAHQQPDVKYLQKQCENITSFHLKPKNWYIKML